MENRGARLVLEVAIGCALLALVLLPRWFRNDAPAPRHRPPIEHVALVILPRGDASERAVRAFAKRGVLLANSHALVHPAAPNRIALLAGSVHGTRTIRDLLDAKRLPWRACTDRDAAECAASLDTRAFTSIITSTTPPIAALPPRTLAIVTIDEGRDESNDIVTAIAGDGVRIGATSRAWYDHYSVLHTIEALLRLGTLTAHDAKADVIDDIWR